MRRRCGWARDPLDVQHHDEEWGVPEHDDRRLFEFLILEGVACPDRRVTRSSFKLSTKAAWRRPMGDISTISPRMQLDPVVGLENAHLGHPMVLLHREEPPRTRDVHCHVRAPSRRHRLALSASSARLTGQLIPERCWPGDGQRHGPDCGGYRGDARVTARFEPARRRGRAPCRRTSRPGRGRWRRGPRAPWR